MNDDDQTGVERQERICRDVAERLGLIVDEDQVFVDNNRSAWQRKRKRPGWEALLAEANQGRIRHVLTYHPDRLMRQPRDLEDGVATEHAAAAEQYRNCSNRPRPASWCGPPKTASEAVPGRRGATTVAACALGTPSSGAGCRSPW
ncbi:recombinase family protein [Streptomyces sp. NPDC023998]|uniref:recombinase family protein n=1 Tax=Streptomyces sp. NPDC023998 TaxID=3154597 RepID=UPI0033C0353C